MATIEEKTKKISELAELAKEVSDFIKSESVTIATISMDMNNLMRKRDQFALEIKAMEDSKLAIKAEADKILEIAQQKANQMESIAKENLSKSQMDVIKSKKILEEAHVKAVEIIKKAEAGIRDVDTTANKRGASITS